MPYRIVSEARGVHKQFWGVVTPQEFLRSVDDFHSHPDFEQVRYTINDFTQTERFELEQSQIEDTAAINIGAALTNPKVHVLAVTRDPVIIGMTRKYNALNTRAPIRVFETLAQAREWLQAQGLM